jgi:hypothetical protein
MKFGTMTFQPSKPAGFDFHVYRVKPETGLRLTPQRDMASNIAVFADTATGQTHPDWISQSPLGPAKFGNNNFNIYWSVLCPTQPEYREDQLRYIKEVDRQSSGVWLNNYYFTEHNHCSCPRCQELHAKSGLGWVEWRRKVVNEFLEQVRGEVNGELVLSLQPDPVSSLERYGVDFGDIARFADRFNAVIFSKNYATPWYCEMLARGFKKLLTKPFYINLYVYGPGDVPQDVPTPAEILTATVRCARVGGVDGFVYFGDGEKEIVSFQKAAVENSALRSKLRSFGGEPVQQFLNAVDGWEKLFK